MIRTRHHVGISVADIERSVRFYTDMLGMELVTPIFPFDGPRFAQVMGLEDARGRMCFLAKDGLNIEMFEFSHPSPAPKDKNYPVSALGLSHFCIEVADIASTYQRLVEAGVRFHCPVVEFSSGIKATYGRDPDGNVFELLEGPAGENQTS